MKISFTMLLATAPLVLASCASNDPHEGPPRDTPPARDKLGILARPIHVPSVTFAAGTGGIPGTIKLAEQVAFGPQVNAGLEVGYKIYEFPIQDANKPIDLSDLRSPSQPIAPPILVTAEISKSGYSWGIERSLPWAGSKPYHVVVTEIYERALGLELARNFDLRIYRVSELPAVQVARFSFEQAFGDFSFDALASDGSTQSVTTSADPDPAPPSVTPSVTFDVAGGTAHFHGKLAVATGMVPPNRTLHLATYYGQSPSAMTQPITFTALASNLVRPIGGSVTAAMCEVVVDGQDVEITNALTHFWVLHVVEIWTTAMGADPLVNSRVGILTSYELADPANMLSTNVYFMK